jgi:hypothetical protein
MDLISEAGSGVAVAGGEGGGGLERDSLSEIFGIEVEAAPARKPRAKRKAPRVVSR